MWEGLGADGRIVWICVAEVVVRNECWIIMCLCKQHNLGSKSELIKKMDLKRHETQLKY